MSIEERFYSEAFEDGVNYAIQRMFADYNWYSGMTDTDHGKAIRLLRDKDETLQDYSPRKDYLMGKLAEERAKELDAEGLDDQTIRMRTGDRAFLKAGGIGALAGSGLGALAGLTAKRRRGEAAAIGAIGGAGLGLLGGGLTGAISANRAVNDMMDQRDKRVYEKRLKEKLKKEMREEKKRK